MPLKPIASIQLWPGRFQASLDHLLESIAGAGYDAVETYTPLFAADPEAFRRRVERFGLAISSAHMELADLLDDTGGSAAAAHALGIRHVVVPHLAEGVELARAAQWREVGRQLAIVAERFAGEGLTLGWSNHGHEFIPLPSGELPIDLILEPPSVAFEPEFGAILRAGAGAEQLIERYGDRMAVVRVRDFASRGHEAEGGWTDFGEGEADYPALLPRLLRLPRLHAIVIDHDHPADFAGFARRSLARLRVLLADAGPDTADAPI